jgi:hypothetical protein
MNRIVMLALALSVGLIAVIPPGPADAQTKGGGCAEVRTASNTGSPAHVRRTFYDSFGCQVPIRLGVGHIPKRQGDFGWSHIADRRAEGATNHETTSYAQTLWQQALRGSRAFYGPNYFCHSVKYRTSGGTKRTMKVFVDYKSYNGYGPKGIITAYWVSGHTQC